MSKEIDEVIDQMTPQELVAFEGELDKKASEDEVVRLYSMGVKMAAEAIEHFQKTGEIVPILKLAQAVGEGRTSEDPSGIDAELDKLSADELTQLEGELDSKIQEKVSEQYGERYLEIGRKMARSHYAEMSKNAGAPVAAAVARKAAPGVGAQIMSFAKKNPGTAAAMAGGVGYLLGDRK